MPESEASAATFVADDQHAPRETLRVLLVNWSLQARGGTESVIRDIALGLRARDHCPLVYAPSLGPIAREIAAAGIPVVDNLARIGDEPDIIHAQHFFTTGEVLIRFPRAPAIHLCHGWSPTLERPPRFPQIRRYVAVSDCTRDNAVNREGIAPERTTVLPNAVDLARIPVRREPLPPRPNRALAFMPRANAAILPVLGAACAARGIEFAAVGLDREEPEPERILVSYDLVFATGRSAIEALSAGCAVIVCDANGLGGLVTPETCERFRRHNFALRSLTRAVTPGAVGAEIDGYDCERAEAVAARMRADAHLDHYLDQLVALYRAAIAEHRADPPSEPAIRDASQRFLHEALPRPLIDPEAIQAEPDASAERTSELQAELIATHADLAALRSALAAAETARGEAETSLAGTKAALAAERAAHRAYLAAIFRSSSWRITAPGRWLGGLLAATPGPTSRRR
jgi:hypothetical protein